MTRRAGTLPVRALIPMMAVALATTLAACRPASSGGAASPPSPAPAATAGTSAATAPGTTAPASRHTHKPGKTPQGARVRPGGVILPNRALTPGAVNTSVTQGNIHATICRTGYTDTIRPPSDYTTSLKETQLASGYAYHGDTSTGDYEEDHLISLELGGAPSDPHNLWPEPYTAAEGARVKDLVENKLHDLVSAPAGATARCADGTYSYSQHRSGTCSHHGGVAYWIHRPAS